MRILLVTPPMVQLNTPYPATAYLTGFLRSRGYDAQQRDPAIDLVCKLFSGPGLERILQALKAGFPTSKGLPASVKFFLNHFDHYRETADAVLAFLQGRDPALALRIGGQGFLPEGTRFKQLPPDQMELAFGRLGLHDRAKYRASLYLDELADVVRDGIDEKFLLSRYGERLAASQASFDPLAEALDDGLSLMDEMLWEISNQMLEDSEPDVLAITLPFPGNVYGGFRIAQLAKKWDPKLPVILGGGYVNTELRSLKDPRVFDFVDYITLDDGERPLECVLEHLQGRRPRTELFRTFIRDHNQIKLVSTVREHDIPHKDTGTPTYDGLPLDRYLSVMEVPNPMHRLWSDVRWNKVTLAHGCYWKKCSFCDITLDYIGRYDPASADLIIDRMSALEKETGRSGFHFVDEAAPPAVLKNLSLRILERKKTWTWWGNIRFDKVFTHNLVKTMSRAGCVAVSGGLEVASDRLLKMMNKGVTCEQVARVTREFRDHGVMVHAYLMYGFPTETEQETVDSLERVRQLFLEGCIQSAFWHRFAATIHSPIGKEPEKFGIQLLPREEVKFAENDLPFEDPTGVDHDKLGAGLNKALYNYMHGVGLEEDVRSWFKARVPKTTVSPRWISKTLGQKLPIS